MFAKRMFPRPSRTALGLAAGFILLVANGQADNADRPQALQALANQGLTDVKEFEVSGDLRAFAGIAGGRPVAVYLTSDGHAIVGTRLDANGAPVDMEAMEELAAKPLADKTWAQLAEATWVLDGQADAPRVVYTFSDANCPYCNRFWEAARPWVDAGKVQLRHLFVGMIKEDSPAKAAAILSAPDPSAALLENERNFNQGGIAPANKIAEAERQALEENQRLMQANGFRGTPGIIVREDDGQIKKFNGMPQPGQMVEVLGPR